MRPKILLFFSSYAPLWALLAIRYAFVNWIAFVVSSLLCLAGVGALLLILRAHENVEPNTSQIVEARDAGPEASSYLASYLLPFLTVSDPGLHDAAMYAAFFAIALLVHLRSSIIQVNPLLYLLQWRVLQVQDVRGFRGYLVTRYGISNGQCILAARLSNDVMITYEQPVECQ